MSGASALTADLQFVTFDFPRAQSPLTMALNVQKVKEVVEARMLSPIPEGSTGVLGIYDLRGCPVPVLAIHELIPEIKKNSFEKDVSSLYSRYVVCELQQFWIALPVQKTGRILNCSSADFLPPPALALKEKVPMITGLIRKEGAYIPVLNLDGILDTLLGSEDTTEANALEFGKNFEGKKVLVVDDSKTILKKLKTVFNQIGLEVETASNGEEAFNCLLSHPTKFDLIFTDIEMPILDGIAFARKVKSSDKLRNIPLIFNSALSNVSLIRDIELENLGIYIVKFNRNEIVRSVERSLGK